MKKIVYTLSFIFFAACMLSTSRSSARQPVDFNKDSSLIEVYSRSAKAYYSTGSYNMSYEMLLRALQLSETFSDTFSMSNIYSNMGNIYYQFQRYDLAKQYFSAALSLSRDSINQAILLNNLGYIAVEAGRNIDSAYLFLGRSFCLIEQFRLPLLPMVYHSFGAFYERKQMPDSAIHYYRLSLLEAEKIGDLKQRAESFGDLGRFYFELHQFDLSERCIRASNEVAARERFLPVLSDNYLLMSKLYEAKGHHTEATSYLRRHFAFKDSILELDRAAGVAQLQRQHEALEQEQELQKQAFEQQLTDRKLAYKTIVQRITFCGLILVCLVLVFLFFQNKELNKSYKLLVKKNLELVDLREEALTKSRLKNTGSVLSDEMKTEILSRVYSIMGDLYEICNPDFSIEKLSDLVHSNRTYVSQIINDVLSKNFRTFLNEYRIREAQRLFLEFDRSKFTIEYIAQKVGFKSRSAFISAFKEVTGVNPNFYLTQLKAQTAVG